MNTETQKILEEQLEKLPIEVIQFISSIKWGEIINEISLSTNLSDNDSSIFRREVILIIFGLVHPDSLKKTLTEAGINTPSIINLIDKTEVKIFTPIRPALIAFFEKEAEENNEEVNISPAPQPVIPWIINPEKVTAKTAPFPENIPTADTTESFLPKLIPKVPVAPTADASIHPFENKMKQVFTAEEQSARVVPSQVAVPTPPAPPKAVPPVSFAPLATTPQTYVTPKPEAPGVYKVDPYREAI